MIFFLYASASEQSPLRSEIIKFLKTSRTRAFTLIELLTVTSIILVLLSLLLSSLKKVRETARGVQCVNNLKNIGQACLQYANENDDVIIHDSVGAGDVWHRTLSKYLSSISNAKLFDCPARNGIGNIVNWWETDYGINYYLCTSKWPVLLTQITDHSQTMLATDCNTTSSGRSILSPPNGAQPGYLHSGGCSILFFDGHITFYKQADIPPIIIAGGPHPGWYDRWWMGGSAIDSNCWPP